ncbi:hypothetical protein DXG01_005939 [Tephrocybe rancida]|nr:hypothetical protein DXG01_005939 [Tephrocybe rancida]
MKRQFLYVEIPKRRPFERDASPATKKRKLGLAGSPTVSDFEDAAIQQSRASPTVSDFLFNDASGTTIQGDISTPIASGSNVTLAQDSDFEASKNLYEFSVDEVPEDDDLLVPGETLDAPEDQNDLPVRILDDFVVFDVGSNELISIAELAGLDYTPRKFAASGLVRALMDDGGGDDEDEDEDDEATNGYDRVILSTILEFNVHSISESTGNPDSNIYLRTKHAWYVLHMPTRQYRPFYVPFWTRHQVLDSLLNVVIRDPRTSYEDFLASLSDIDGDDFARDAALASVQMLGRVLTEEDIQSDDVKAYITAYFPDMCDDYNISVHKVLLSTEYLDLELDDYAPMPSRKSSTKRRKTVASDKEIEVLKHETSTYITPIVSQIMRNLFSVTLDVAENLTIEDDSEVVTEIDNIKAHHADPASIKWGPAVNEGGLYSSVVMDGVEYCVGDNVMVTPGDDEDARRAYLSETDASQSPNSYANRLWFCKICYFYEDVVGGKKVKMFHGQWFIHGSKTILQETAHSKSLFLLHTCENNPAASIFKKCNVTMMGLEDGEIPDNGEPLSNDFHCALAYDEDEACFTDLPSEEEMSQLLDRDTCISCALKGQQGRLDDFVVTSDGYSRHGINYHANDFVYIRPSGKTNGLLEIAQIVKIRAKSELQVTVRYLARPHKQRGSEPELAWDERRLHYTDRECVLDDAYRIDGLCYVHFLTNIESIDDWTKKDDHFYANQGVDDLTHELYDLEEDPFDQCDTCEKEGKRKGAEEEMLLTRNGPIRCLELFSGAGGLGTGLDLSGFVQTKYAVEFSPSAAATYALLKQAYEAGKGEKTKPLMSGIDGKQLPAMPKRGDIDMISGGPPCQSFSRANHNPRPDDVRSTLPGNMLSYVELYNPQYFLLENVAGLLTYRLMSTRSKTKRSLEGGIESGMVKFIMRTLIALGYQVRCKVLQAGQYGAPQSRRRTIFWGAKRGTTIPDYPVPAYAFEKGMNRSKLPTFTMEPVSRSLDPDENHQCAPLRPVTVNETVSDLPPFDWKNPHKILPATAKDKKAAKERLEAGIPQFHAVHSPGAPLTGFPEGVHYLTEPQNRYQQWLRRDMGDGEKVHAHYTKFQTAPVAEATVAVPLRPKATHWDIPRALQPKRFRQGKTSKYTFYGRLDGDEQFKCAMTSAAPNSKNSWLLHPSQKRIMSVRELARSQGFPDHYEFLSIDNSKKAETKKVMNVRLPALLIPHSANTLWNKQQIRQIGNAVPVPLALYLGRALGKALLKDWKRDGERREREGSVVV